MRPITATGSAFMASVIATLLCVQQGAQAAAMGSSSKHAAILERHQSLAARNPTGNFNQVWLASNYQNLSAAPVAAPGDAAGQTVITSGGDYGNDDGQVPQCPTIFIQTAQNSGSEVGGWTSIPQVAGFYVDRNTTFGSATAPVYIETGKDYSKVKRVVVAGPGKPRDAWKYVSLFRNSLVCAVANESMPVVLDDVLVVAPMWLSSADVTAGAGESTDLFYSPGGWSLGSKAQGPGSKSTSAFDVLDKLLKRFADQSTFPALTSVTFAGHSLGASLMQRYAMLKNDDAKTDPLIRFWIGNPGAYVWPSADRPVTPTNTSCQSTVDDWAYGIGGAIPAYAEGVSNNVSAIYQRYRSRTIQYALGMLDNGPGDTHCEAQYQGASHLERGQNMQKALEAMSGGLPSTQSFNYVPDTSHQDYRMMADSNSQEFLFVTGLDDARPAGTQATASSSGKNGSSSKKGGNGSSSGAMSTMALSSASLAVGLAVTVLSATVVLV